MEVDTESIPLEDLAQDETLWFDDGNIIIAAEDCAFRVYRGVLVRKSDVFKDLFSLPQPSQDETLFGCSVVRVQDAKMDMYRFLRAIFDGSGVWEEGSYTSWEYIRSILLLSNKYQVDSLRDRCIQELRVRFPGNIKAWDRWYSKTPWNMLGTEREAISMANVLRLLGLRRLHARALYDCCQLSTVDLVGGIINDEDIREVLSTGDLAACVDGRETLVREASKLLEAIQGAAVPKGTGHTACSSSQRRIVRILERKSKSLDHDVLRPDQDVLSYISKMCTSCDQQFRDLYSKKRQDVLTKLPHWLSPRYSSSSVSQDESENASSAESSNEDEDSDSESE